MHRTTPVFDLSSSLCVKTGEDLEDQCSVQCSLRGQFGLDWKSENSEEYLVENSEFLFGNTFV